MLEQVTQKDLYDRLKDIVQETVPHPGGYEQYKTINAGVIRSGKDREGQ